MACFPAHTLAMLLGGVVYQSFSVACRWIPLRCARVAPAPPEHYLTLLGHSYAYTYRACFAIGDSTSCVRKAVRFEKALCYITASHKSSAVELAGVQPYAQRGSLLQAGRARAPAGYHVCAGMSAGSNQGSDGSGLYTPRGTPAPVLTPPPACACGNCGTVFCGQQNGYLNGVSLTHLIGAARRCCGNTCRYVVAGVSCCAWHAQA